MTNHEKSQIGYAIAIGLCLLGIGVYAKIKHDDVAKVVREARSARIIDAQSAEVDKVMQERDKIISRVYWRNGDSSGIVDIPIALPVGTKVIVDVRAQEE